MSESPSHEESRRQTVRMQWDVRIPLRDGIRLSAILYLPAQGAEPGPGLVALTPYTAQRNHARASYFAVHGYFFLSIDVRGRGNSEGVFRPFAQEAEDGYDVIEWVAQQPFCNGKVAMFSGSYEGYVQWAIAAKAPRHLASIAPGMAAAPGIDFPMRHNIPFSYLMQWLTLVSGATLQERIFEDHQYWRGKFREWLESGRPFRELDEICGNPSAIFQEWLSHPEPDSYWGALHATESELSRIEIPVLTITGIYDGDQPGALHHYRQHLRNAKPDVAANHYLVIGPWDHFSVLAPRAEFGGLKVGPSALIDVLKLHLDWYRWTLCGGPRPEFLARRVAYYVMGADRWRYADSLEAATARTESLYLDSQGDPTDVWRAGLLTVSKPARSGPDRYRYDPRDTSLASLESSIDPESRADSRMVLASSGHHLVYHSEPMTEDIEIAGFFRVQAWLAIDQPDTDFRVSIYDVDLSGQAIQLSVDSLRARYREGLRQPRLVNTRKPLRYDFERFTFVSRLIRKGHRLRLVLGPLHSIYSQKNYNSGGVVSQESMRDARVVNVSLFHDAEHPSALYVPIGQSAH